MRVISWTLASMTERESNSTTTLSKRRRSLWGTRFGFYLAAVGSAFGLGNLWRFPYVTVENGGGAFVLIYIVMALAIGLPLLIGELMLGKISRRSVVSATYRLAKDGEISRNLRGEKGGGPWMWTARLAVVSCLLILSYYAVISGWVLHFLMQFFVSQLKTGAFDVEKSLSVLREHGGLQIALMSVHLLIALVIVGKGVQEGIEKWVSYSMPAFIVLLFILVMKSLSLPSATDALRFMFYPDFTKLTLFSPLDAIGHVMFTLSIGFGTMVTFGSYLNETTKIPGAGFRITAMDTVISLFAGLLIFPLLIGATFSTTGPELLFQTLPRLLVDIESGFVFGMAFFICLYLAALGASIGLLESVVANLLDFTRLNRAQAAWLTGAVACLLGVLPALSTSTFHNFTVRGHGLLEVLDGILINGLLPISALGVSFVMMRKMKRERLKEEFLNDDSEATEVLYSHWLFALKWVAPTTIILSLGMAVWGLLR
jgi:NSS family neurotransmitter:Na+ symporter